MPKPVAVEIPLPRRKRTNDSPQETASSLLINKPERLNSEMAAGTNEVYMLAFGAHPDDVEISAGAILRKVVLEGKRVAVCDLTEGEMGTRGSVEEREQEAKKAMEIIGYTDRKNLRLGDAVFENSHATRLAVIEMIRYFRPLVILAPSPVERHPDHERAARLIKEACFYSGLSKIETKWGNLTQERHRPSYLFYYLQDHFEIPDLIVDVTESYATAREALLAFESQFHQPKKQLPSTYISRKEFLEGLDARAILFGELIGARYGQGLISEKHIGISHFSQTFSGQIPF